MMENTHSIIPVRIINGVKIEFKNIMELAQGGPEVGDLYINDKLVSNSARFSAPLVLTSEFVFAPVFKRGFWKTGFQIAKINLTTHYFQCINGFFPLVNQLHLVENRLAFYTDIECRSKLEFLEIE